MLGLPWGVEFDQNVFAFVVDNIVEVLRDDDFHVFILLGDRLRFQVRFELALDQFAGEVFQTFETEIVGHAELLVFGTTGEHVFAVFLHVVDAEFAQLSSELFGIADGEANVDTLIS